MEVTLAYISAATRQITQSELSDLWLGAIERNEAAGLTGALLFNGEDFVHVLEGDEPGVRTVLDKVRADPRHTGIQTIFEADIVSRRFRTWPLKLVDIRGSRSLCDRFARENFLHNDRMVRQEKLLGLVRL